MVRDLLDSSRLRTLILEAVGLNVRSLRAMRESVTLDHPHDELEGRLNTCSRRKAMRQSSPSWATPPPSTGRLENAYTPSSGKPRRRWNRSSAGDSPST